MKRVILLMVLCMGLTPAFSQRPKKAVKAYENAESAFLNRDYKKAYQQVVKAIVEDPNYAEAWLLEGEIGMETQDYDMAILGYEKALACDSMLFPPAAITLARLYDRKNAYKKEKAVLDWYQKAAKGNAANDAVVAEMLTLASFRDWATSHPVAFEPNHLGMAINSKDDEYVNMLSFDGTQLLFMIAIAHRHFARKEQLCAIKRKHVHIFVVF